MAENDAPILSYDSWCGCGARSTVAPDNDNECANCGALVASYAGLAAPLPLKLGLVGAGGLANFLSLGVTVPVCAVGGAVAGAFSLGGVAWTVGGNGGHLPGDPMARTAADYSVPAGAAGVVAGAALGGASGTLAGAVVIPAATAAAVDLKHTYKPRHHCRMCGRSLCQDCLGSHAYQLSSKCNSRHKVCRECCEDRHVASMWRLRDFPVE